MSISAAQVKKLRDETGAGMMECKKALEVTNGDFDRAIEELRKAGSAKAGKKASRIAADGVIIIRHSKEGREALMVEVNCETDFVARDQNFLAFANTLVDTALAAKAQDVQTALNLQTENQTIEESRQALVAKVGENINVRRLIYIEGDHPLGYYLHSHRIGVIVVLDNANAELARDIAMHIAASKPLVITPDDVPAEMIAKEKEIYTAQAANSGKSQEIIEKMVKGRIKKYLDEISLLGQPFVKEPEITIASLLTRHRSKVLKFIRFEVGEGIEKEKEDFVGAVMSQVQGV